MALADRSSFYAVALVAQCVFYLLAGYGAWLDGSGRVAASRMPGDAFAAPWHDRRLERQARSPQCLSLVGRRPSLVDRAARVAFTFRGA